MVRRTRKPSQPHAVYLDHENISPKSVRELFTTLVRAEIIDLYWSPSAASDHLDAAQLAERTTGIRRNLSTFLPQDFNDHVHTLNRKLQQGGRGFGFDVAIPDRAELETRFGGPPRRLPSVRGSFNVDQLREIELAAFRAAVPERESAIYLSRRPAAFSEGADQLRESNLTVAGLGHLYRYLRLQSPQRWKRILAHTAARSGQTYADYLGDLYSSHPELFGQGFPEFAQASAVAEDRLAGDLAALRPDPQTRWVVRAVGGPGEDRRQVRSTL